MAGNRRSKEGYREPGEHPRLETAAGDRRENIESSEEIPPARLQSIYDIAPRKITLTNGKTVSADVAAYTLLRLAAIKELLPFSHTADDASVANVQLSTLRQLASGKEVPYGVGVELLKMRGWLNDNGQFESEMVRHIVDAALRIDGTDRHGDDNVVIDGPYMTPVDQMYGRKIIGGLLNNMFNSIHFGIDPSTEPDLGGTFVAELGDSKDRGRKPAR